MNLPLNLSIPEAIAGSAGVYHQYAKSASGNKLFLQFGTGPCLGRRDGQTYHAVGLLMRLLFAGDEPVAPEHFELREKKPYKKVGSGDEIYAQQLNKMLFPVATINIGAAGLLEALGLYMESLTELLQPLLEANAMAEVMPLMQIFEAQNPNMLMPVVNFDPPKSMKSWAESVAEINAASKAGYQPKADPNAGSEEA